MTAGFIGTGSMGAVLVHALVRSNALRPDELIIHNRTSSKAEALAEAHPGVRVSHSAIETAVSSDILFICVKPPEYKNVLEKIAMFLRREQILVSVTSPVLIRHLEKTVACKVAKVIPSLTNHECSGATLCMYGGRMTDSDIEKLESLLGAISKPVRIREHTARACSDITSIGPAFIAFFIERLVEAAVREAGVDRSDAIRLAGEMTLGTGLLLTSGGFTPESLQRRISVPGGITAKALDLIRRETEGLFEQVLRVTHQKYDEDVAIVEAMLSE